MVGGTKALGGQASRRNGITEESSGRITTKEGEERGLFL